MSIEENKKLVRRYCEEVFDQGRVDLIDQFFAPHLSAKTTSVSSSPTPRSWLNIVLLCGYI